MAGNTSSCVTANCVKNVDVSPEVLRVGYTHFVKAFLGAGATRMPAGMDVGEVFDGLWRFSGLDHKLTYGAVDWVSDKVSVP